MNPPAGEEKYWKHVGLMMDQLEGMMMGLTYFLSLRARYNEVAPESERISFQDLYMHNADGDMETLLDIYRPDEREVMILSGLKTSGWKC